MYGELRKFVSPEFVFGVGARSLVGRYAQQLGASRVLVVSDPGVKEAGWTGEVTRSLLAADIYAEEFLDVTPNPRDFEVTRGAEKYHSVGCDFIVAVGGGSPIDCAKGIGTVVVHDDRDVRDFEGVDRLSLPTPPLVCIPTTAGTGADVSQFAIILDTVRSVKIALVSKSLVPDLSLIDPETLITMPTELTIASGMDALCHCMEAFVSSAGWPLTDMHALAGIRLIDRYLLKSVETALDLEMRGRVMLASLHGGLAFSNAGLGIVHAMAHAAGGLADAAHGESNAILLEPAMRYNLADIPPDRARMLAEAFGRKGGGVPEVLEALRELVSSLGIESGLASLGIKNEDLSDLAALALRDPCLATNPRIPSAEEIVSIYEQAL